MQSLSGFHIESLCICRLCLLESEYLKSIFHPEPAQEIVVWKTLEDLLQIQVSKDDGFPETICKNCLDKVVEFDSFKQECLKSTMTLLNFLAGKEVVEDQSKCNTTTPNEVINYLSISSLLEENISTNDCLCNQEKDPLDIKSDCRQTDFDGQVIRQENATESSTKENATTIMNRSNVNRNMSLGRHLVHLKSSTKVDKDATDATVVQSQIKNEDNSLGGSPDSGDEISPTITELDNHVVFPRISGKESWECLESEELIINNIRVNQEDPMGEPSSDTKPSHEILYDENQTSNFHPVSPCPSDDNTPGHCFMKEENDKKWVIMDISGPVHQTHTLPQQMPSLLTHPCGMENLQHSVDHSLDDQYLSCARVLSVHVKRKTRANSKNTQDESSAALSQTVYSKAEKQNQQPTTSQFDDCIETGHNVSSECYLTRIRNDRQILQRAAKQQNCSEKKSSSSKEVMSKDELGIFKCIMCCKIYRNKYFLGQHIRKMHQRSNGQLQGMEDSNLKSDTFSTLKQKSGYLTRHKSKKSDVGVSNQKQGKSALKKQKDGLFHCLDCDKVFKHRHRLKSHLDGVHKGLKKQLECHICGVRVTRKYDLKTHFNQVHGVWVNFQCLVCSTTFGSRKSLRDHERRKHGLRVESVNAKECVVCKKTFSRMDNLNRHMSVHQKCKEFVCEQCGKKFREERILKMHQRRKHEIRKSHQCEHCSKLFVTKYEVQSHVKIHLKE